MLQLAVLKKIGTMLPIPDTGMIKLTTHNIGISGKTSFIQCCDMISLLQIAIKSKNIVLKTKSWVVMLVCKYAHLYINK